MNGMFIGNPYAFVKDNVVTHVVMMGDRTLDAIEEEASKYDYDSMFSWESVGREVSVGWSLIDGHYMPPKPYPSWKVHPQLSMWIPPVEHPSVTVENTSVAGVHKYWKWNEEKVNWEECDEPCFSY